MTLKLAHISDIHLGAKLTYLGNKAEEHRLDIRNAFKASIDKAIEAKVALFIIAGDLFDNPFPSKVSQIFVLEQIKRLMAENIYTVIVSGNHDRNEAGSVFNNSLLTQFQDPKFKLFNIEKQQEWVIESLDTVIFAAGTQQQKNKNTPYQKLVRNAKYKFNLGVFHGSADVGVKSRGQPDNYPIYLKELYASNFDYIALGDWHNMLDLSKDVPVWYSGSPELIDSDQDKAGYILLVELAENHKHKITPVKVGSKTVLDLKFDLTQIKSLNDVVTSLKIKTDKNALLNLSLAGFRSLDNDIDSESLQNALADMFYYVRVIDQSKLKISEEDLVNYPDSMIIGKYIKLLQSKKDKDPANNEIIDQAIQFGVNLLKGGKI